MEEKKITKINLPTFFLILSIIVIIVTGMFMYKFYNERTEENQKLYDYNKKISIICPKEWKFVYPDIDGGELHIETIDSTINKYVGINLTSHENIDNETLYEHLNSLAEGYDDYHETQIKGINAIIYNNKSQIQYGECVASAFFMKDSYIYEVSYYSNDENLFEEHYKTFESVLSTVEL